METIGETCKYEIVWRDRERPKQTKETVETVDTCKYKIVQRDRERPKETKETVETVETKDTCKYEIVWRDRDQRRLKRLQRLWRQEVHASTKQRDRGRPNDTEETVETVETSGYT